MSWGAFCSKTKVVCKNSNLLDSKKSTKLLFYLKVY